MIPLCIKLLRKAMVKCRKAATQGMRGANDDDIFIGK